MSPSYLPHRVVAERVHEVRKGIKGYSAARLAERMSEIGFKWDRFTVQNLERGRRAALTVEELVGLADCLDVAPIHLLVPTRDAVVQLFPQARPGEEYERDIVVPAEQARDWFCGKRPLPGTDIRVYFTEVPEAEFRERFGHGSRWSETVAEEDTGSPAPSRRSVMRDESPLGYVRRGDDGER